MEQDSRTFKDNTTREERHMVNEAIFDEETIEYSSANISRKTKLDEEVGTTTLPIVLTTMKKGKYLGQEPTTDNNIKPSIPNTADGWALAGVYTGERRKKLNSDESNSDLDLLSGGLNNTAKNLLDWTEIAKMNNNSMVPASEDYFPTKPTIHNDISGDDDPATSENKNAGVFVASRQPSVTPSTAKVMIEDNQLELEGENVEFSGVNKTSAVNLQTGAEIVVKSPDDKEESAVEIADSLKKDEKKEELRLEELIINKSDYLTTISLEAFTTDSSEMTNTTKAESLETTTSIAIDGEDEADEVFKRTIPELLTMTTDEFVVDISTTQIPANTNQIPVTTTTDQGQVKPTSEAQNNSVNEIPESTVRYNKSTKSIRATTTESPSEEIETTVLDNTSVPSKLNPKYTSTSQSQATAQHDYVLSTTSSAIEIIDDDKFRYSTWLPQTKDDQQVFESGGFDELLSSTIKTVDPLEKESLDGEDTSSGSLGLISAIVSVVVVLCIAGVGYVS